MNRCPITYNPCGDNRYSDTGLRMLSAGLTSLKELEYTAEEQRREAYNRASKMSIQGIQPKLSAKLKIREEKFEIVDTGGKYILKPQHQYFPEMPENEDLTMKLADEIALPLSGNKKHLTRNMLVTYYGMERCELTTGSVEKVLETLSSAIPKWRELINISFLSKAMKDKYLDLLDARLSILKIQ